MAGSTPPPGPVLPPCGAWITADDLERCDSGLDAPLLDEAAVIASMLMYELSGRQFSGLCGPVTVRPARQCSTQLSWAGTAGGWSWSWGYWSGDWGYDWGWGNDAQGRMCSCGYDSYVELAGYPVREIEEVKIDGAVIPSVYTDGSPQYRLDQWRYLTRLTDPSAQPAIQQRWPRCQRLDLDDDQPGTWSVTYAYGVDPPPLGVEAATQIGCQVLLAMSGEACQLPNNVTQMVRQGNTIQRVTPLAQVLRAGGTGLFLVDAFLASYNPNGLRRRPSVFTPDLPYPRRVGAE
jgi:hypothetical protein